MLARPANTNSQHGFPFNVLHCNPATGTVVTKASYVW